MRKLFTAVLASATVLGFAACFASDLTGPDEFFELSLTGDAVRPSPVDTDATARVRFERHGGMIHFTIDVEDITGVTMAHIHGPAASEETAGVIVTLLFPQDPSGEETGRLVQGSFNATDEGATTSLDGLLALMRSSQAYIDVHTSANPAGEIRGQIVGPISGEPF